MTVAAPWWAVGISLGLLLFVIDSIVAFVTERVIFRGMTLAELSGGRTGVYVAGAALFSILYNPDIGVVSIIAGWSARRISEVSLLTRDALLRQAINQRKR